MIIPKIKAYAYSALGFAAVVLSFLARIVFLKKSRDKYKKKAEEAEVKAHVLKRNAEADNEIKQAYERRRAKAAEELRNGNTPDAFRDPNKLFDDTEGS